MAETHHSLFSNELYNLKNELSEEIHKSLNCNHIEQNQCDKQMITVTAGSIASECEVLYSQIILLSESMG